LNILQTISCITISGQDISSTFPNVKYVLIDRRPAEVLESLLDFQPMNDYEHTEKWVDKLHNPIKEINAQSNILSIKFLDINDMEVGSKIWNYVLPEIAFNEKRWYFLDELYVNILIGKVTDGCCQID
jgi:hypothetical protein